MLVVTVRFDVAAAEVGAFREAMLENAAQSLSDEPGCHRFDVSFANEGRRCFLYELYKDAAAFEAHLASEHYRRFAATVAPMLQGKEVEQFELALSPAR